jgi:hypothetical protein
MVYYSLCLLLLPALSIFLNKSPYLINTYIKYMEGACST